MGCFSVPKAGHAQTDNQDWVAELELRSGNGSLQCRAVAADGVTHSYRPGVVAQELVQNLLRLGASRFREAAWNACRSWQQEVDCSTNQGGSWLAGAHKAEGAACTFVMVETSRRACAFHAVACGDACLFVTRDGALIKGFPIGRLEDFPGTPDSLQTQHITMNGGLQTLHLQGTFIPGRDVFYLMTDELARWTHCMVQAGEDPFLELRVDTLAEFQKLVARLRREGAVQNDDMSLCWMIP